MTETTTLQALKTSAVARPNNDAPMSLMTGAGFEQLQRVAKALTASTLVPVQYRAFTEVKEYGKVTGYLDNPAGLANCVVALNMAVRMGADPLLVMQNLYVIEGRPSWSSQFIIAQLNNSGKFSPLKFDISEPGKPEEIVYKATEWVNKQKTEVQRKAVIRHQTCTAWVIEKETGERLNGPTVSIQMAIDEGWLTKNGSKWLTMPEIMLRYRAASLLGRIYAPELLMGLQSREEVEDFIDAKPDASGEYSVDINDLRNRAAEAPAIVPEDPADAGDDGDDATDAQFTEDTGTGENIDKTTGEITQKGDLEKPKATRQRAAKPAEKKADPEPEPEPEPETEVDPAENVKPSTRKLPTLE